jgi:hypothetical protein
LSRAARRQPLAGAQLVFEPEAFLGADVPAAQATTDASGSASVSLAAEHLTDPRYPGVAPGWYRVKSEGPALPPRYDAATTLGGEIASDAAWVHQPGEVLLDLTSKCLDRDRSPVVGGVRQKQ